MNNKSYFKLYASCIPVKGVQRSVICDLQYHRAKFITNDLYEILTKYDPIEYTYLVSEYGVDNEPILEEYFTFLEQNEFGFWCEENELNYFPKLDLSYHSPYQITNAIIDQDKNSKHDYHLIFRQLDHLGSVDIQLRYFDPISLDQLESLLQIISIARIKSVQLVIPYSSINAVYPAARLIRKYLKICQVVIYSAPFYRQLEINKVSIQLTTQVITDESHCGVIHQAYFNINTAHFAEARNYNSCLNQKISIDKYGQIKNCPSMSESFGNIEEILLSEAVNHPKFKETWNIGKADIDICKDCESRYICSDCRAYVEKPDDIYSKPLKCGYNPKTNEWTSWSANPLKQVAIVHYGLNELKEKRTPH